MFLKRGYTATRGACAGRLGRTPLRTCKLYIQNTRAETLRYGSSLVLYGSSAVRTRFIYTTNVHTVDSLPTQQRQYVQIASTEMRCHAHIHADRFSDCHATDHATHCSSFDQDTTGPRTDPLFLRRAHVDATCQLGASAPSRTSRRSMRHGLGHVERLHGNATAPSIVQLHRGPCLSVYCMCRST